MQNGIEGQFMKYLPLVVVLLGCGASAPNIQPTVPIDPSHRPEMRELPPDPGATPPTPSEDWALPIEAATCTTSESFTFDVPAGIELSEEKVTRCLTYRTRYDELRSLYESDRMVWGAHRELYEERLRLSGEEIYNLQPDWWDENKFAIGVAIGVVLGIGVSIGVYAAADNL